MLPRISMIIFVVVIVERQLVPLVLPLTISHARYAQRGADHVARAAKFLAWEVA